MLVFRLLLVKKQIPTSCMNKHLNKHAKSLNIVKYFDSSVACWASVYVEYTYLFGKP